MGMSVIGPGDKITHYEILGLIGRGGMGEVWQATTRSWTGGS